MPRASGKAKSSLIPERIGPYDVILPIASGGMATVYLGRTRGVGGFERDVALKVMHAHLREDEAFSQDLVEEAKLAVRIQHPNVVRVHDVGDDPHGVYLVMDYVEGDSLAGLLRSVHKKRETLPERIGLRILVDALMGLHAAHELTDKNGAIVGLVHRDFSPQNILVGIDGVTRLADFGVAKASTRLSHTATGLVKGKIHYMSPEQAKTEPLDRRCDVWAAGVIAWEILAKQRLYKDANDASIIMKLLTDPAPRLRRVSADISEVLDQAVAHALTSPVEQRCATAKDLADRLEEGAAAYGGLATTEEVGTFVKTNVGENLERRREKTSKVLSLRESLVDIAGQPTSEEETAFPDSYGKKGAVPESTASNAVTKLMAKDGAPVDADLEPEVTSTSQAVPVASSRRGGRRNGVIIGAISLAGVLIGVVIWGLTPPPEPVAEAATAKAEEVALEPLQVQVTANADVADLVVGERAIALEPASKFAVTLRPDEQQDAQQLRAISVDGRRVVTQWTPGQVVVNLTFEESDEPETEATAEPAAVASSPPKLAPATPIKPPPPPPTKTGPSLAPNPFD